MHDLEATMTEYVYDLKGRDTAPGTIRNYTSTLAAWADWVAAQDDAPFALADVAKEHVTRFIGERTQIEAPSTVLTRFRHLRAFFKWAEREEIIEKNPMRTLHEPSAPVQPPPVLTSAQLRAIFTTTRADRSFFGVRDYAMLLVLADTGMRVGELVGMHLDDIDFDAGSIEVLGKGRRRRRVAFQPKAGKAMLAYLRARAKHSGAVGTDRVWIGQRGTLREAAVWGIVKARGEDAGVEGVFPHLFRHTMAHRFRVKGGQDSDLQSLGGWRSPAMLARYGASAASERAIEAHRRVDHLDDVL